MVLSSFSRDLCLQLLRANRQTIFKHRERFKYGLSYKWLLFESIGENDGKECPKNCPNTVTLCGYCVPKNQLGNIALMALIRYLYNRDPYFLYASKVTHAWSVAERYPVDHPHQDQIGDWAGTLRADNAAAFGLGIHIGTELLITDWGGTVEGCADVVESSLCDIDHRGLPEQTKEILQSRRQYHTPTADHSGYYTAMLARNGINPGMQNDMLLRLSIDDLGTMLIDGNKVNVVRACRPCMSYGPSILDRHHADKLGRLLSEKYSDTQLQLNFENYSAQGGYNGNS